MTLINLVWTWKMTKRRLLWVPRFTETKQYSPTHSSPNFRRWNSWSCNEFTTPNFIIIKAFLSRTNWKPNFRCQPYFSFSSTLLNRINFLSCPVCCSRQSMSCLTFRILISICFCLVISKILLILLNMRIVVYFWIDPLNPAQYD